MRTAFKMHVNSEFKVSLGMKVTLGKVIDILAVFSNHVCYKTQVMPIFQVLNFFWIQVLLNDLSILGKYVNSSHRVYM